MAWNLRKKALGREIAELLHQIGAIKFGEFTLASGLKSPWYLDLRLIPSFTDAFDKVGDAYVELIRNEVLVSDQVDRIAGVLTAGLPLATVVSYKLAIPLIYVRQDQKGHGLQGRIEGVVKPDDHVLILDDLVTTAKSTLEDTLVIRQAAKVNHVVVLLDREQGGAQKLQENGVELHSLVKVSELFAYLKEMDAVSKEQYNTVMAYTKGSA